MDNETNNPNNRKIYFLESNWDSGGSTVFDANLANELSKLNHYELGVISINPVEKSKFLNDLIGFPVHQPPKKQFTRRRILLDTYPIIRNISPDCLILTIHRDTCEIARHLPEDVVKIGVIHAVDDAVIELANTYSPYFDAIVSVSNTGLNMMTASSSLPKCPTHFILPGIIMPDASFRRETNFHQPIRLLYLGRLTELSKRARSIVQIAADLKKRCVPFEWTIAGVGPEADFISQTLKEMRINEVTLIGSISHKDLPLLFSRHDVIVSTSDKEAFNLALHEAMAFGLVPVAGDAPGRVTEIVEAANGFLVDANEPSEFGKAITVLHQDRNLLADLSNQAHHAIHADHSWGFVGNKWHTLLDSLNFHEGIQINWPTKLKINKNLHVVLPIYLSFVQTFIEYLLSISEFINQNFMLKLRKIIRNINDMRGVKLIK